MRHLPKVSALVLVAALAAACNSQKEPAEAAVKTAHDAYVTLNAADMKYVPTDSKNVRDKMENAQSALERAAYPLAIENATGLPEQIEKLKTAIAAEKARLTTDWAKASATLPPALAAITAKMKNGGGLAKAMADKDQAKLDAVSTAWTEATVAADSGDVGAAMGKAVQVKMGLEELMKDLKMKTPAGW